MSLVCMYCWCRFCNDLTGELEDGEKAFGAASQISFSAVDLDANTTVERKFAVARMADGFILLKIVSLA